MDDKEVKKKTRIKKATQKNATKKTNEDQAELGLIPKEESIVKEPQKFIHDDGIALEFEKEKVLVEPIGHENYKEMYPRYLSSSINLLSFLCYSLGLQDNKIIPAIEISFLSESYKKTFKDGTRSNLFSKNLDSIFTKSDKEIREFGNLFFSLFSDQQYSGKDDSSGLYDLCYDLVNIIDKIKEGENSLEIVLNLLSGSKEIDSFPKLKVFLMEYQPDQFSQLNTISEKIITLLNEVKVDDKHLTNWKTAVWAFLWVIRYSTQSSELLVDDLLKKKSTQFKELHITLIGLFTTKLFHSKPSWKPIALGFQNYSKMKFLQPAAEIYYNPNIITSLSSDPILTEKYFWTYITGNSYSIFEKPSIKKITRFQKKQIEVEEKVIVEEKTFGDFITITGEVKSTGIILIKT